MFKLQSKFKPSGDQPQAISALVSGVQAKKQDQVLLGVTGSGKTFTMANIIEQTQRPALIMAHNKTLAAQVYEEMKEFFPDNAVEYFVSYYDYYQPEAYIPRTDTYIEKDSSINDKIDLMRHSATRSILERKDTIIVASVSCIYGLGAPELYLKMTIKLTIGDTIDINKLYQELIDLSYERNETSFYRGCFRSKGDTIDIFPSHYEDIAWRIGLFGNEIESIIEFDPLTVQKKKKIETITIFAKSHYVTPRPTLLRAVEMIKEELYDRLAVLRKEDKIVEAKRIEQKTTFDMEMIIETGTCKGIENYSRYLSGRKAGDPPPTLFEYLPKDALLFIDESHVTVPQIGGMYNGDRARKMNLVNHGFRLPSALDNRPLIFEEWLAMRPQTMYISATPGKFEMERTNNQFVEQVIRPTWLIDPICTVKPVGNQVQDVIKECKSTIKMGYRALITTLTKRMAEDLSEYMSENGIKNTYLHSDIDALERIEIIHKLRSGNIDVLIGVNLLREGLDIPECGLVAIMDADKEGFLRSATALIQTIGRAARNIDGYVILYADKMTNSLEKALKETERRRDKQSEFNKKNGIKPQSIKKKLSDAWEHNIKTKKKKIKIPKGKTKEQYTTLLRKRMLKHASNLEFEEASELRDTINDIESSML